MKKKSTLRATEGIQLTEDQIQTFVNHYNETGKILGNKIVCTATGKSTVCVAGWRDKKIKEYGGIENLLRNYKCRGVNKTLRAEKIKPIGTSKKGRKKAEKEETIYDIPKMTFKQRDPLAGAELTEMTKKICMRPDVFLDNNRACNGCPNFELCVNSNKCLIKGFAFKDGQFVEA
jgi:hypothetical protein